MNGIGDRDEAGGSPINFCAVYFKGEGVNNGKIVLIVWYNGSSSADQWLYPVLNTMYYLTIERNGNTYSCDIYGSASNRESEINPLAELSVTVSGIVSFRYLYGCQSMTLAGGDYSISGFIENLELIIKFTITFYYNEGGIFRVNDVDISNNTQLEYSPNSTIEFVSIPENSSFLFKSFNWTGGYNTTNPYNYTAISDNTIWCYFAEKSSFSGGFILAFIIGLCLTIIIVLSYGKKS